MGEENISNSAPQNGDSNNGNPNTSSETQVTLNVYDLTPINQYCIWFGLGIFHSGIEEIFAANSLDIEFDGRVHGMEYGFGAHDFPISGVFEVEPKTCPGFVYRCSVPLGHINMHPSEFRSFIESVASEYHGDTYHLISKNCNHFTSDMARRLTGKGIPGWVNRLAHLGAFCSCLLPESLQVTTVKQLPEYHPCNEDDGSGSFTTNTPHEPTESDDGDQDTYLLSPTRGNVEVAFIKETLR